MGELNEGGGGWEGISLFFSIALELMLYMTITGCGEEEEEGGWNSIHLFVGKSIKNSFRKMSLPIRYKQDRIDTVVATSFKTTTTTATATTMQRCFIVSFALFYGDNKLSKIAKSVLFVETRWDCRADANLYQFKCCFVFAMSQRKYMKTTFTYLFDASNQHLTNAFIRMNFSQ